MGRNNYHQIIYPIGHIQKATRSSIMHSKSELNHVNDNQYLSTFHWGSIRWVGSESCSFFSKENSHRPPSWIASERRDWKLVSRFCFGQQCPVHRRFLFNFVSTIFPTIDHLNSRWFSPLFCSLNADPQQGNALKNKTKKVSVNYTRVIFHLKPWSRALKPLINALSIVF